MIRLVRNRHEVPPILAPLPDVTTARLDLRRFEPRDLDELAAVFALEEVWRFPFERGLARSETKRFLDGQIANWNKLGFGIWAARTLDDGRLIGFVGISVPRFLPEILPAVEVGWRLSPSAWGYGYATEGAAAALDQSFTTLGLDSVYSVPQAGNPRSARVAERLGMSLLRQVDIPANQRRGAIVGLLYEMSRQDWLRHRGSG